MEERGREGREMRRNQKRGRKKESERDEKE